MDKKEKMSNEEQQAWDNAFGNESSVNSVNENSEYAKYEEVMNNNNNTSSYQTNNVSNNYGNNDGLNNAALAVSIISFFLCTIPFIGTILCVVALILSIKARAKRTSASTGALVVSIIALIFRAISLLAYIFMIIGYMVEYM